MATGDTSDITARLQAGLPKQWFPSDGTIIGAVLGALATAWAWVYQLYAYIRLQSRILTASDGWLDIIAGDFFGTSLARAANQTDASLRAAIIANLFREKATRAGLIAVLQAVTGRTPIVVEPQLPMDCGAYGIAISGYGVGGAYGSMLLPFQAFVTAFRPLTSGIPYVPGYGNSPWGYGVAGEYASLSMVQGSVQDADIYAAIDAVKPVGTTIWARITS